MSGEVEVLPTSATQFTKLSESAVKNPGGGEIQTV
jgi:hypothetical protein